MIKQYSFNGEIDWTRFFKDWKEDGGDWRIVENDHYEALFVTDEVLASACSIFPSATVVDAFGGHWFANPVSFMVPFSCVELRRKLERIADDHHREGRSFGSTRSLRFTVRGEWEDAKGEAKADTSGGKCPFCERLRKGDAIVDEDGDLIASKVADRWDTLGDFILRDCTTYTKGPRTVERMKGGWPGDSLGDYYDRRDLAYRRKAPACSLKAPACSFCGSRHNVEPATIGEIKINRCLKCRLEMTKEINDAYANVIKLFGNDPIGVYRLESVYAEIEDRWLNKIVGGRGCKGVCSPPVLNNKRQTTLTVPEAPKRTCSFCGSTHHVTTTALGNSFATVTSVNCCSMCAAAILKEKTAAMDKLRKRCGGKFPPIKRLSRAYAGIDNRWIAKAVWRMMT